MSLRWGQLLDGLGIRRLAAVEEGPTKGRNGVREMEGEHAGT